MVYASRLPLLIKTLVRKGFRYFIVRGPSRRIMNCLGNRFGWKIKERFHGAFGYALRDYHGEWSDDVWVVKFMNTRIKIPLRANHLMVDWIIATTLFGHDVLEKQSYENILSHRKPEMFFDIGGNYGTHSLLFLSQGIDVVYFEPNSTCHTYFINACRCNGYSPRVEHVALGDICGNKELQYPELAPWLGSTDSDTQVALQETYELISEVVYQKKLDCYLDVVQDRKLLVKIDAEGYEFNILRGAALIFAKHQPIVFFESSVESKERDRLWEFFADVGYVIGSHVWDASKSGSLSKQEFLAHKDHNFWAEFEPRPQS